MKYTRLALAAALAVTAQAQAADRIWTGAGITTYWSFASLSGSTNWTHKVASGQAVLQDGDSLTFAGTVGLSNLNDYSNLSLAGLNFKPGAGAFQLGGVALTSTGDVFSRSAALQTLQFASLTVGANQRWDGGTGGLLVKGMQLYEHDLQLLGKVDIDQRGHTTVIGQDKAASLTAGAGSTITSKRVFLANHAGSSALVTLDAGASWAAEELFYVGTAGDGTLSLSLGAQLSSAGGHVGRFADATGRVTLASNSVWTSNGTVHIGYEGQGQVTATSSQLKVLGLTLGALGGHGTLVLDGTQATLSGTNFGRSDHINVGGQGQGTLLQTRGSSLLAHEGSVGSVNVGADGLGARWEADLGSEVSVTSMSVHAFGLLRLTGESVGRFSLLSVGGVAGAPASGLARMVVDGGATVYTSALQIGANQRAEVRLTGGGTLTNTNAITIGPMGSLVLDGGTLATQSIANSAGGRFDWRSGQLRWRAAGGLRVAAGGALGPVLSVPVGGSLLVDSALTVGAGGALVVNNGASAKAGDVVLEGGTWVGQLNLAAGGSLSGYGQVLGSVRGGHLLAVDAGQALTVGSLGQDQPLGHFPFIRLSRGSQLLVLSNAPVTLGDTILLQPGALLATVHGVVLSAGQELSLSGSFGDTARVRGELVNNGHVLAYASSTLVFEDPVSGSGAYYGNLVFSDDFTAGSPGQQTQFNGNVDFASGSTLHLSLGSQSSHLRGIGALGLDGQVVLAVDSTWAAGLQQGARIDLLDFAQLSGGFSQAQVAVQGIDRSRLDLSRLAVDGTVGISPVPEPEAAGLMALGLAVLAWRRRSRTPA